MPDDQEYVEIETDHGTIRWKEQTKPSTAMPPQIIRELMCDEQAKLRDDAEGAAEFLQRYVQDDDVAADLLENLDMAFAAWLHSDKPEKEPDERVIRIVGAAYGQYCIDRLAVRWAILRDEQGTEMGLIRRNPVSWSFPFSSIRYRVEDKQVHFVCALYESFAYNIKRALADAD